jgi:anti-anti-sigma regulatory factor
MSGNLYCDSSGLAVLGQALRRARALGGELRIVAPQTRYAACSR